MTNIGDTFEAIEPDDDINAEPLDNNFDRIKDFFSGGVSDADAEITGDFTANGFIGDLTGNADTATSATSATSATNATNATNLTSKFSLDTSISDVSYSGTDITETAGETVSFGDICYFKSDGKNWMTDADAVATASGRIAMSVASISADASGKFLLNGLVRNDAWNWTVGAILYLSTTAGDLTETAPSDTNDVVRIIGYAKTADIIYFNPSNDYIVVA